jgi:Uma2 family endonuclease
MTAQAHDQRADLAAPPAAAWTPDPGRQRAASYTVEDVLGLEWLDVDTPRQIELRDGVMWVPPSPTFNHQTIAARLWTRLTDLAPAGFVVSLGVGVMINSRNTLEPDVIVLREPVEGSHHYFDPASVAIAVEVVSPGTMRRDRLEKPPLYADAGVPHYWRIEQAPVLHVFAYDLTDRGVYRLAADSTRMLNLTAPFTISLPIDAITP